MRITFLSWRDTGHPDGGGAEVYVEQVARGLARSGHRVTVVTAAYPGAASRESIDGVTFIRGGGRLSVYLLGLWHLTTREGRRQDVVVDVINGLPFAARLVRRRGLVALVHHTHREQWRIIYPGLWGRIGWFVESRLTPRLYRNVPHVTVSEASRADLIGLGIAGKTITVVHNGAPAATSTMAESRTPRLCTLARLVPHKRIEQAIDVVRDLAAEFPDLTLDVIGDGWWAQPIAEHVAAAALGDRVNLHGHVSEEVKADLLDQAWLMLLPSVKEGWGIAVMEAAAHGTPSLAYRDAGGVAESVKDRLTGALVEDYPDLLSTCADLLRDAERRQAMSDAARRHVADYTWESTVSKFEKVISAR